VKMVGVAVIAGLLGLAGVSPAEAGAQLHAAGTGILTGRVTRWPAAPVEGPGISRAAVPAPGLKLVVYGPPQQELAAVITDARGEYRVTLPPGTYRIDLAPAPGRQFTKDLPATVVVVPGQETRLDVRLDTGRR